MYEPNFPELTSSLCSLEEIQEHKFYLNQCKKEISVWASKLWSFEVSFCLKTSVVLNLLKEISRSQDLYFRSTNYIFPIVINRKFVLNAKGYWFYQTGRLDLLILSLRYIHLPVEIKSVLVWKLRDDIRVWEQVSQSLKRLWLYFHPHPIQNVGFKRIILKLCLLCTEFPNS